MVVHNSKPGRSEDTNSVNMKNSLVPDDEKGTTAYLSDSAVMKSSSTRSKDNNKIMRDNTAVCATGVTTLLQNGIKKMAEAGAERECSSPAEDCAKGTPKEEHGGLVRFITFNDSVHMLIHACTHAHVPIWEVEDHCYIYGQPTIVCTNDQIIILLPTTWQ